MINENSKGYVSLENVTDSERTECEIWTRVMGYHRPVNSWNIGKQAEHAERQYFNINIKE